MKVSKFAFESGKTYRVEFGLYDVNSTDVRAVLTVDGKEILSYEAENEYLHSAKGRFGVVAAPNGMDVTLGSVGTKLTIDSLIDDETNWKTITNTFAPKFIASKMLLNGKSYTGYAGEKFTNRVLHFKYRLTFSEDAAAAGEWGGLYFNAGGAEMYPWTGTGILACIKSDVIELQVYEDGTRTKFLTNTENLLDSSKTYRMTFGMYDVNSTDVRIVLTADDVTLFDETVTSAKLHSLSGYFGASASDAGVRAELGSLGNKINVATLVRSEGSWKTYTGNAPEFKDGSLSITSSEARFPTQQTMRIVLTADDVTLFDVTRTNANLHGMAGYFSGAVSSYTGILELGSLGNKVNVSTLVRDEANWTTYTGGKAGIQGRKPFHHEQRRRL